MRAFAAGVLNGILNPFGVQDAAGKAYLDSTALRGEVQSAKVTTTGFDIKGSRELMQLAGGPLAIAIGGELRREKADFNVNRDIAGQATSSGLSGSLSKNGSRTIQAVFAEVIMPVSKDLEVQLAARFDHYSDVGSTTNPKLALRYQASTAAGAARLGQHGFPRADLVREECATIEERYQRFVRRPDPVPGRRAASPAPIRCATATCSNSSCKAATRS